MQSLQANNGCAAAQTFGKQGIGSLEPGKAAWMAGWATTLIFAFSRKARLGRARKDAVFGVTHYHNMQEEAGDSSALCQPQ